MKYGLNVDAINERLAGAVVAGWDGGQTAILIPGARGGWFNLVTGGLWGNITIDNTLFIIRPGDRCQISHDKRLWFDATFVAFRYLKAHPYRVKVDINSDRPPTAASFIRPAPKKSSEKIKIEKHIIKLRSELDALQKTSDEME